MLGSDEINSRPAQMSLVEPAQQHDYKLAASLRQGTWELLERSLECGKGEQDTQVIVALQDAANLLGAVERRLQHPPRAA
jgi:hypothetical protein